MLCVSLQVYMSVRHKELLPKKKKTKKNNREEGGKALGDAGNPQPTPNVLTKVVDTVPAGMYYTSTYTGIKRSMFCTGLNIGRTNHVPVNFGQY